VAWLPSGLFYCWVYKVLGEVNDCELGIVSDRSAMQFSFSVAGFWSKALRSLNRLHCV
jgi:hypothetical protein